MRNIVVAGAVALAAAVTLPLAFSAPGIAGQEATVRQLETEIAGLDARYAQADSAYRETQAQVEELTRRIAANAAALAKAKRDFAAAQVALSERLSIIYRQPTPTQVELLLRSGSVSEAIAGVDNLQRVQRQDARTIVRIRTARAIMVQTRAELVADRKTEVVRRAEAKKHLVEVTAIRDRRRGVLLAARSRLATMIAAEVARKNAARAAALRAAQEQVDEALGGGGNGGGGSGATPPPTTTPTPPASSDDIDAKLRQIALCESGGNPKAVSPSGLYRGKYQFDPQTWAAMGGAGTDPAAASEAEQDRVARLLYEQRGAAPWPVCGR